MVFRFIYTGVQLTEGAVASIKVLVELFQKLAGIEGAAPLIDLRRGRNTQDLTKSSFFRILFSSLKEKRKNNIFETIKGVSQITLFNVNATRPVLLLLLVYFRHFFCPIGLLTSYIKSDIIKSTTLRRLYGYFAKTKRTAHRSRNHTGARSPASGNFIADYIKVGACCLP